MQLVQSPKVDLSKPSTSKATPDLSPSPSSTHKTTKGATKTVTKELDSAASKNTEIDIYQDMPKLVGVTVKSKPPSDAAGSSPSAERPPQVAIREEEAKRLCSETRRILLCHQEHAMTLTELAEHFCSVGDPTSPTAESLYAVLKKQSSGDASERKFEVCMYIQ